MGRFVHVLKRDGRRVKIDFPARGWTSITTAACPNFWKKSPFPNCEGPMWFEFFYLQPIIKWRKLGRKDSIKVIESSGQTGKTSANPKDFSCSKSSWKFPTQITHVCCSRKCFIWQMFKHLLGNCGLATFPTTSLFLAFLKQHR